MQKITNNRIEKMLHKRQPHYRRDKNSYRVKENLDDKNGQFDQTEKQGGLLFLIERGYCKIEFAFR